MKLKLLQLLMDNRREPGVVRQTKIVAAASSDGEAVVYLYDPIVGDRATAEYFGCVCAQDLVPEIDGIKAKTIRVRFNCPGGDVFAMQAIMNALRNHAARKVGVVDGVAASAATGIAMTMDELIMEPGSLFMIHNSQGLAYGDKNDLRSLAELQDKVDGGMNDAYAAKSGKTTAEIAALMDAETWFTAEETVAAGFASAVNAAGKRVKAGWNLSAFANAPKAEAEPEIKPEPKEPEIHYITDEHRERQQQRLRVTARLSA